MHKIIIIATAIGLSFSGLVFAQSKYELGTKLSPAEISALGNLKSFSVSSGTSSASAVAAANQNDPTRKISAAGSISARQATYRIVSASSGGGGYVIDDRGQVGKCDGVVLISGIATDLAKKAFDPYQASIVSVKVYDNLKIVSATFSNLAEAANARNELATKLTGATVSLPVIFDVPQLH
ncbi:hypothetical protein [Polynucleobacter sp. IMCC 29146]|uniref:hypothetical protein n=2 Tax=unclassified Polynucleobacter TaxID=2640945 RepID=UPI001F1EBA85|nr:hypothetical protein [Polynucleobacter sp. IMCC 29146]MCE7529609.1 hypothetical protein [Polynucleobacter sp. IMCC 29146]